MQFWQSTFQHDDVTKRGHQEFWVEKLKFWYKKVIWKFSSKILFSPKPRAKSPPMLPKSAWLKRTAFR